MSSSTISTHDKATASLTPRLSGEQLERRLEELLHQDRFAPPPEFVATEHVNDASLHARAELDPNAFWAEQAQTLHWDKPFTTVLDDSNPPVLQVVHRRQVERVLQLPRSNGDC